MESLDNDVHISNERVLDVRTASNKSSSGHDELVNSSNSSQNRIIGCSQELLSVLSLAQRVAKSTASILITGESGTGKEVIAKYIHGEGRRRDGPFIAINCSAIPEALLESELFGHAKGSFTGAISKHMGLFEEAQNGTLFLDEIGDLNLALQAKLLRVLQEKKIRRVGENQYNPVNCRIVSATHKDLFLEVQEGRFREDLFFRLNVIPIHIPPLRDRKADIRPLAEFFLKKYAQANGSTVKTFSETSIEYLLNNEWKGNVRELENTIERVVVLSCRPEISLDEIIPSLIRKSNNQDSSKEHHEKDLFSVSCKNELLTLEEVIHKYIEFAVQMNGGARDQTAIELGIDRKTLYKRLRSNECKTSQS
jgi:transcriptional regulator with PAS, ATPase and Fis domain